MTETQMTKIEGELEPVTFSDIVKMLDPRDWRWGSDE